jgi:chaperone BCS1
MDIKSLMLSGIALAAGGTIAYALKDIPNQLIKWIKRKTFYSASIYQYDELFNILEEWMAKNFEKKYNDVEASLNIVESEIKRPEVMVNAEILTLERSLVFKQEENHFIIKEGGRRILISKTKEKMDKAQTLKDMYFRKYVLRGFMAKKQINGLLEQVAEEFQQRSKQKTTLRVFTNTQWGDWVCVNDIVIKSFQKIILPKQDKESLIADIQEFVDSKKWYHDRGILHKRGYLYYGEPGNGKTSVAMATAEMLGRDLYLMNLNSFDNDGSLVKSFNNLGRGIVLLIEDVDGSFVQRESLKKNISFSGLLNSIDGALCKDGVIVVLTTNHVDKLDPALIRDGRIDKRMEIKNPAGKEIAEYLELFYGVKIVPELCGGQYSMSYVQEYCIRHKDNPMAAITHFTQQKKVSNL